MKKILLSATALMVLLYGLVIIISPFLGDTSLVAHLGICSPHTLWSVGVAGGIIIGTAVSGMYFWNNVVYPLLRGKCR